VAQAARAAQIHDFIAGLPDGYETIVGERGLPAVGRRAQRIAIARALLQGPEILILDEATSSLDSTNEALIQAALDRLLVGAHQPDRRAPPRDHPEGEPDRRPATRAASRRSADTPSCSPKGGLYAALYRQQFRRRAQGPRRDARRGRRRGAALAWRVRASVAGRTSLDGTDDSLAVDARPLPHADGSARRMSDAEIRPGRPARSAFAVIGDYGSTSDDRGAGGADGGALESGLRDHDRRQQLSIRRRGDDRHEHRQALRAVHRQLSGARTARAARSTASGRRRAITTGTPDRWRPTSTTSRCRGTAATTTSSSARCTCSPSTATIAKPDGNSEGSAQARWLEAALAASSACLDVVYFHHPGYSSGPHGSTLQMRWPFESWGADVVFAGHDHIYERVRLGGIRQFIVGVSGNETYTVGPPIPESEARVSRRHGALLVTVGADGTSFQFFADDRSEVDAFNSYKPCSQ
jgi:hypothetical protein